jgi:cysteine synthase A
MVEERDKSGGYLLNRIRRVRELMETIPRSFNPNQYENNDNYLSYYHTLGNELCEQFDRLDYVFVCVSSGGTITGLSLRLKEKFPQVMIIAVDVEGSLIFDDKPKVRKISGLGSSMRTAIIDKAHIDDVLILSQEEIVKGCHCLLNEQGILAGASSGAVYEALKTYNDRYHINNAGNVSVLIIPDSGNAYISSIYNHEWVKRNLQYKDHEIPG